MKLDLSQVPTPCYVVDEALLRGNLRILKSVQDRTGCKILLALKGFAMFSLFPGMLDYLAGTTASGLHEALLGAETFGGELHVCGPAFSDEDFREILKIADHVSFNSFSQWRRLRPMVKESPRPVECGLRINPEHREVAVAIYDPCAPCSRLGTPLAEFQDDELEGITGLHFHTLCELNSDALERTLAVVEQKFGKYLDRMQWVNFGGGHHITRPDYDVDRLCRVISDFKSRRDLTVYLEPGEAIALRTGVLVASVLDVTHNGMPIAILDASAAAHMPDCLEMPYRPDIVGSGQANEKPFTYRLGGPTCLAGDVIGDYSFDHELSIGDKLVFTDMAHYTMVKNNTFNGVRLPSIARFDSETGAFSVVRNFGYEDYKMRLS